MSRLNDIKAENRNHLTYGMCTGIFVFLGLAIALMLSIKKPEVRGGGETVSLLFRFGAAMAFYWQNDYYRRKVLILIQEKGWAKLSTFFCGLILALCAALVLYEKTAWLLLFGAMMIILASRNVIAYISIRNHHAHPLRSNIVRWVWGSLGYTLIIFSLAPLIFTLEKAAGEIHVPMMRLTVGAWYIGVVPALILLIGMLVSILRLDSNLGDIEEKCQEYYGVTGNL